MGGQTHLETHWWELWNFINPYRLLIRGVVITRWRVDVGHTEPVRVTRDPVFMMEPDCDFLLLYLV